MKYRRPFDWIQRAAAAQLYKQYRINIKTTRAKFPPGSDLEWFLFRKYRSLVEYFARELLKTNDRVDVNLLNELERDASNTAIQYNIENTLRRLHASD